MVRRVWIAVMVAALALVLAQGAGAAVRMGPDLTTVANSGFISLGCNSDPQYNPCVFFNYSSTDPEIVATAPSSGVITRWRFAAGCCSETTKPHIITLRTLKPGSTSGGNVYATRAGTGPSFVVEPGQNVPGIPAVSLPAHLPIAAGDYVGIEADTATQVLEHYPRNTAFTVLHKGFDYGPGYYTGGVLDINADVEPDADGDGYGDETQDCKPNDPTQQGTSCVAPPASGGPLVSLPAAGKQCGPGDNCGGPSKAVVFSKPVQPAGPRSDGGINVTLSCPVNSPVVCGGVFYAELPAALKASVSKSVKKLGSAKYSLNAGQTKKFELKFSKSVRKFLAKKTKRKVTVTVQPNDGSQPISTAVTLKFKKKHKR